MIEVEHLTKRFGRTTVVDDVSFSLGEGEIVGFLGPNGAGKTTTMRMLAGFSAATSGRATIAGYDVATDPLEVRRRVGYLPESVPVYQEMVVDSYLRYVSEVKGVLGPARGREVSRVVECCGLGEVSRRTIRNLSRGYRQRVGLAQALIASPPVLILDEPTVGLDPKQIIDIRRMIKELAKTHTVLLSTHILPEVAMICERVVIIHQGRVVASEKIGIFSDDGEVRIEVTVGPSAGRAKDVIEGVPCVKRLTSLGGDQFSIVAISADAAGEIARTLVEAGLVLKRLEERRRGLEDLFIEAISEENVGAPKLPGGEGP